MRVQCKGSPQVPRPPCTQERRLRTVPLGSHVPSGTMVPLPAYLCGQSGDGRALYARDPLAHVKRRHAPLLCHIVPWLRPLVPSSPRYKHRTKCFSIMCRLWLAESARASRDTPLKRRCFRRVGVLGVRPSDCRLPTVKCRCAKSLGAMSLEWTWLHSSADIEDDNPPPSVLRCLRVPRSFAPDHASTDRSRLLRLHLQPS